MNLGMTLEGFELNVENCMVNIDPYEFFQECFDDYRDILTEAGTGATKDNIIEKLITALKRFIDGCTKLLNKIITFITSKFKKKPKSTEQILIKLGVVAKGDIKAGKIVIPSSEESVSSPPFSEINAIVKPMFAKFNDDGSVTITANEVYKQYFMPNYIPNKGRGKVAGHKDLPNAAYIGAAFNVIRNVDLQDDIKKCAQMIQRIPNLGSESRTDSFNSDINDVVLRISKGFYELPFQNNYTITVDQLKKTQILVNEVNTLLQDVTNPDVNFPMMNIFTSTLNNFVGYMMSIQMGLNLISDVLRNIYVIDISYANSISDAITLSSFVKECIDAGIPPKYIALNVFLLTTRDIKGQADADKPVWGQSRMVLFPNWDSKIVYKIALSSWGINSNKSELIIYNKFKDAEEGEDLFAKPMKICTSDVIIEMEKVDTKAKITEDQRRKLVDMIDHIANTNKIPLAITGDIHQKNIGLNGNGKVVAIDYSPVGRSYVY